MKIENIADMVDKAWADKPLAEIAAAPISALKGVTEADAQQLKAALGVETISDMANCKQYAAALEIKLRAAKQ